MTCTCGAALLEGAKFCGVCGATVAAAAPAPAEPVAPAYQEPSPPVFQEPQPVFPEPPPVYQAPAQPIYQEPVYQQPVYQEPVYQQQPMYQQQVAYQPPVQPAAEAPPPKGSRYAPISAGGYFGYFFLFSIPVIGLILSIVWANDKTGSINRQNLAKLMLVMMLLGVGLAVIAAIFTAVFWSSILGYFQMWTGSIIDLPSFYP